MKGELLAAVANSDPARSVEIWKEALGRGERPWDLHLSLYPVVQRVMNPPFINPHLPKMYHILRELRPYLGEDDLPALVGLELNEYARRPKLPEMPRPAASAMATPAAMGEIQRSLREKDGEKAATLMAAFLARKGKEALARELLLLGSGYLENSLGHAVSCTAFILLEMIERGDEDPWPALATLADYFCKGGFYERAELLRPPRPISEASVVQHLRRAASGRGILNLHHPITLYPMERARHLLTPEENDHMFASWVAFVGDKAVQPSGIESDAGGAPRDYHRFFEIFCELDARSVASSLMALAGEEDGLRRVGRYLVKALCDRYRGDYNPHHFTALGSALWVLNRYPREEDLAAAVLYQYLDYLSEGMKP